ncbi:MAG: hypothetical protein R3257_04295 [bacterium]|nr:hypothetical protein [bacterium]
MRKILLLSFLMIAMGACTQGDGDSSVQTVQVDSKTSAVPVACEQEQHQDKAACKRVLKSLSAQASGSSAGIGTPVVGVFKSQVDQTGRLTSASFYLEGKGDFPVAISTYTYFPDGKVQIIETVTSSAQDGNMDTKRTQTFTYFPGSDEIKTINEVSGKIHPGPGEQPRITDTWLGREGDTDPLWGLTVPSGEGRKFTYAGNGDSWANNDFLLGESQWLDGNGRLANTESLTIINGRDQGIATSKTHQWDNDDKPIRVEETMFNCVAQSGSKCKDDIGAEHLNPGMIDFAKVVGTWTYNNEGKLINFTETVDGNRDPAQSTGVNGTPDFIHSCDITYGPSDQKVEPYFTNFFKRIGLDTSLQIQSMICTDEKHPDYKAQFDFEYAYLWEVTDLEEPQ